MCWNVMSSIQPNKTHKKTSFSQLPSITLLQPSPQKNSPIFIILSEKQQFFFTELCGLFWVLVVGLVRASQRKQEIKNLHPSSFPNSHLFLFLLCPLPFHSSPTFSIFFPTCISSSLPIFFFLSLFPHPTFLLFSLLGS